MPLEQSYSRINTLEVKALIVQKIGRQRAEKYFDHLRRLFSFKISKREFNKFCVWTIGKENVSLHNQLIRSIMKNACLSKIPPTKDTKKVGGNLNVKIPNECQKSSLQSLYGDSFPCSPRKGRSPMSRDRRLRDHPSPLGPFGKPQRVKREELISKAQKEQQSATELFSLGSRPPVEIASVEDGEEVEQATGSPGVQSRSPVTAPFGISVNLRGSRKSLGHNYRLETCQNSGELPDTRSLRTRVKRKLEMEGISISVDCANLLNNALDAYLKRLIEPCASLAGSRCGSEHSKHLNRRFLGSHFNGTMPTHASLLDFRAAMDLNPRVLGEDWSVQLEKVSFRASEE